MIVTRHRANSLKFTCLHLTWHTPFLCNLMTANKILKYGSKEETEQNNTLKITSCRQRKEHKKTSTARIRYSQKWSCLKCHPVGWLEWEFSIFIFGNCYFFSILIVLRLWFCIWYRINFSFLILCIILLVRFCRMLLLCIVLANANNNKKNWG